MDELRILIARLGWPSTAARWWSMQELAARLGEPAVRDETECALLKLLSSRKLEAEVVEVLCIFWMAAQAYDYSPTLKLAEGFSQSSILSDLFLENLGLLGNVPDEGLVQVPKGFKIPEDFDDVQGVDLPRIFRTSMEMLESHSRLPFVQQMAFEWTANRAAYPNAPFQGNSGHFLLPMGQGFVGHLSSRTALRAISAYLRTLAVAEELWSMPTELAEEKALLALPIHPTLALLSPQRPVWFPTATDFDGDVDAIVTSLRALVSRIQTARPGDELIAFSSPLAMTMERCVEVSIVRWSQAAGSAVADADLAAHLEGFWSTGSMRCSAAPEPLSTTTLLEPLHIDGLIDNKCKAWPLAAPLGFDRLGYLQHDLYPGRLFLPTLPGYGQAELTPCGGQLDVKAGGQVVADFCYWNTGWGAVRPAQLSGNCGTALTSRGTGYREGYASTEGAARSFYLWQVRVLHRASTFDSFNQTVTIGSMFV